MKFLLTLFAALSFLMPVAQADELSTVSHSCRAKSVEKFYCPVNSGWWNGPFYDSGCSVQCEDGQRANCEEASCDDGDAVPSSCSCN